MTFHPTNNPFFWQQTAESCFAEERYMKAAEAYLRLCEMTPGDASAWAGRGKSLMKLERFADAVDALERSLMIEADNADVLQSLGEAYQALGNTDKAAACFVRAGELSAE
ncbi:MAG TPA: tetratricopeptide repeat protein [Methanocorpusculum sp.]|nr:tetratricopeptide repeat protein [Methanocorpusculum sp.]